jgi:hypothetical protein
MSFFLDDEKTNLSSLVIPVGVVPVVTAYSGFSIVPNGVADSIFSVAASGDISIGQIDSINNLVINTGTDVRFVQITDTNLVDYTLTGDDYAVEIIADSINTVTLPTSYNIGGRTYIISRGSNNNNLIIRCHPGENIDTRPQLNLSRKHAHVKMMSNGQDSWYII